MKKATLLFTLLFAFALTFTSCKKEDSDKKDTEQTENDDQEEVTEEETTEEEVTEEENTEEEIVEEETEEEIVEEEVTEEETIEEEEEETNTGSFTKTQLTGTWTLQNPDDDNIFCQGVSEVFTFKDGENNAYLSCNNEDPFVLPYTLNGNKLTLNMDFMGKPTLNIETLNETTLIVSYQGDSETYIKQ